MKKLFSLLLVTLMLLSPFAMCVNAESVTEQAVQVKDTNTTKITSDLQAHLDTVDDDEYVPVYVWLNDYGEDMLYEVLSQRLGKTVTADTEESYIQDKIEVKEKLLSKGLENLAKTNEYKLQSMSQGKIDIRNLTGNTFKAQANLSGIMTDEEIDTCIESNMTSSEIIELSERNQFLSDYRQSRKTVNTAVNTTFYNSLDLDKCRNIYLDPLLCRVTMECKKSYVDDIEGLSIVNQMGIYEDRQLNFDVVEDSVALHDFYINKHMLVEPGVSLNAGAGIRIGVIELTNSDGLIVRYYDTLNPHLLGKTINFRPSISDNINFPISTHATSVLSILCGNPLVSQDSGETYQGIAPYATVSLANISGYSEFSSAMDWLLDMENVSVINYSGGLDNNGEYSDYDKTLDEYISLYRVTFVKSAGNNTIRVTAPGMAYNAITVGNFSQSKTNLGVYKRVVGVSCYDEMDYLTNKPDVVANGTNVHMLGENNIVENLGMGTSFAAPQVAGTVALMMQANPDLIGKPEVVKNLLLLSADEEAIYYSETENELVSTAPTFTATKISDVSTILREESGAGLLNIAAAIRLAKAELYYDLIFVPNHTQFDSNRYYFTANSVIEFGIVFEKATNEDLSSAYSYNYDIQILNSNNVVVFNSTNTINNVEQFSCKIKSAGYYKFRITYLTEDTDEEDEEDQTEDNIVENRTEDTRLSFALACGCVDKNITAVCEDTYHQFVCTSNGCITIKEPHSTMDLYPNSLSDGSNLLLTIYYLFDRGNVESAFECYKPIAWIGSGPNMVQYNTMEYDWEITYTTNGEIRKAVYAAIVEENGVQSLVVLPEITIEIDYISRTVNAYWSS